MEIYKGLTPGLLHHKPLIRNLLALGLGLIGYWVNQSWHFLAFGAFGLHAGEFFSFLAFVLYGPWLGLVAGLISKLPSMTIWAHGYGMLITAAELAWLGMLPLAVKWLRGRFFILEMGLFFWLGPGLLLHLLCYGWVLDMGWHLALLLCLKEAAISLVMLNLATTTARYLTAYSRPHFAGDKMILFLTIFMVLPITLSSLWFLNRENRYFTDHTRRLVVSEAKLVAEEMSDRFAHTQEHLDEFLERGEIIPEHVIGERIQEIYLCSPEGTLQRAWPDEQGWPQVQGDLGRAWREEVEKQMAQQEGQLKKFCFSLSPSQLVMGRMDPDDGLILAVFEEHWAEDIAGLVLLHGGLAVNKGNGVSFYTGQMPMMALPQPGEIVEYPQGNSRINERLQGGLVTTAQIGETPWQVSVFHPYTGHMPNIYAFLVVLFLSIIGSSVVWIVGVRLLLRYTNARAVELTDALVEAARGEDRANVVPQLGGISDIYRLVLEAAQQIKELMEEKTNTQGMLEAQSLELAQANQDLIHMQQEQVLRNNQLSLLGQISQLCSKNLYDRSFTPDMLMSIIVERCDYIQHCAIVSSDQLGSSGENSHVYLLTKGRPELYLDIETQQVQAKDCLWLGALADTVRQFMVNRRLFQQVAGAKAEWESTFDAISDVVFITDAQFRITRANRTFLDRLGKEPREVIGQPCYRLLKNQSVPCGDCIKPQAVLDNHRMVQEGYHSALGQEHMHLCYPFQGVGKAIHILKDDLELQQAREKLVQAEKLATLGLLVSNIAHELNNPLATVTMAVELCGSEPVDRKPELLDVIKKESGRMKAIVENLLQLVRPQVIEKRLLDLDQIIGPVIHVQQYQGAERGTQITYQPTPEPVHILGDANRLTQLLINIMVNAQQAIDDNQHPGQIVVFVEKGGVEGPVGKLGQPCAWLGDCVLPPLSQGRVRVIICDNGPGIAPEHMQRIFEPLYTTKADRGTGLGLSVSYQIAQEHGGELCCYPALGGAVFCLELPQAPCTQRDEDQDPGPLNLDMGTQNILVLDDEELIVSLLTRILKKEGHRVTACSSGVIALEMAAQQDFDLYICDLRMPDLSGQDFYAALKTRKPQAASKFLFLSGDTISTSAQQFLKDKTCLNKPFSIQQLFQAIKQVI